MITRGSVTIAARFCEAQLDHCVYQVLLRVLGSERRSYPKKRQYPPGYWSGPTDTRLSNVENQHYRRNVQTNHCPRFCQVHLNPTLLDIRLKTLKILHFEKLKTRSIPQALSIWTVRIHLTSIIALEKLAQAINAADLFSQCKILTLEQSNVEYPEFDCFGSLCNFHSLIQPIPGLCSTFLHQLPTFVHFSSDLFNSRFIQALSLKCKLTIYGTWPSTYIEQVQDVLFTRMGFCNCIRQVRFHFSRRNICSSFLLPAKFSEMALFISTRKKIRSPVIRAYQARMSRLLLPMF